MILSNECYIKTNCAKFRRGECALDDSYCIKLDRYEHIYAKSLLTKEQRKIVPLSPEAVDSEAFHKLGGIKNNISEFVDTGKNLFIYSSTTGNGKTSWAVKFLQAYVGETWDLSLDMDKGCRCLFINVPKFFMMLKDNISEKNDYIAHIKKFVNVADIVVWDDIGTKMGSEYEIENLLSIINYRLDSNKSNIFTANIVPAQLEKCLGARLASRINGSEYRIELKGHDRRVLKSKE